MLGLRVATDPAWVETAVANVASVLADHAHCEMKAAANALSLAARALVYPQIISGLVLVAEEELRHFRQVLAELERRSIPLGPPAEDYYAAELRRRTSTSRGTKDAEFVITDRLLVGALIEARSCERFKLLSVALAASDPELAAFYGELLASEARHYRTFLDFAALVCRDPDRLAARLDHVAEIEAQIVRALPGGGTIHG